MTFGSAVGQPSGSGVHVGSVSEVRAGADLWTEEPLPGTERPEPQGTEWGETCAGQ